MIPGIFAGLPIALAPPSDYAAEILADNPSWYCRHAEAALSTVAVNEVGDNGVYENALLGGTPLYTGGLTSWSGRDDSADHCDIPASVFPAGLETGFTLEVMQRVVTDTAFYGALIDRDPETSVRKWQYRLAGSGIQAIQIEGGVMVFDQASVNTPVGSIILWGLGYDYATGIWRLFKNGLQLGADREGTPEVDFGHDTVGLRINRRLQGDSLNSNDTAESAVYLSFLSPARHLAHAVAAGLASP